MSTRSYVGFQEKGSDNVKYIYVHHDGYLEGVGAALKNHFTDPETIRGIIDEGDRSSWDENSRVGQTDSSGPYRDGSSDPLTRSFEDLLDTVRNDMCIEYLYVFSVDENKWRAYGHTPFGFEEFTDF